MADTPPAFDAVALIDQVRRADPGALERAYQATFAGELGRLVLAHHLAECGVGKPIGGDDLKYRAGQHDAAIHLAAKAAVDQPTIAVAVLTDTLEENPNDQNGEFSNPGLVPDEDALEFN